MTGGPTRGLIRAGLLIAVALAWANGLTGEFTYDDKVEVIGNPTIRWLEHWSAILTYNIARPVVMFSWAVDFRLWGDVPLGFHLTNVAIHGANALLLFAVGERLLREFAVERAMPKAAAAAALWALHPMTTEAVTYVTGRSESLCATFMLLSTWGWLRWRTEERSDGLAWAVAGFLLALATKEVGAMQPLLLVLIEFCLPPAQRDATRGRWALGVLIAVLAAGAAARKMLFGVFTVDQWLRPIDVQLWTQLEVITAYLKLWLLPLGQSIFHDHPEASVGGVGWLLLALWGSAAFLALRSRAGNSPHRALPLFILGWWLLLLIPSSSFVPLLETMAEHRAYLAGWAVALSLVCAADAGLHGRATVRRALLIAVLLALGLATHRRNALWHTEVSLWNDAVQQNAKSAEGWYGYGDTLRFAGELDDAIDAYDRALAINPDLIAARTNRGVAQAELGRQDEAEATWKALLKEHPKHCPSHNNLGWLYYRQKRWHLSAAEFRSTLTWCPTDIQAHYALGNLHYGPIRDAERAAFHYEAVLFLDDTFIEAEFVRGKLLELTF